MQQKISAFKGQSITHRQLKEIDQNKQNTKMNHHCRQILYTMYTTNTPPGNINAQPENTKLTYKNLNHSLDNDNDHVPKYLDDNKWLSAERTDINVELNLIRPQRSILNVCVIINCLRNIADKIFWLKTWTTRI